MAVEVRALHEQEVEAYLRFAARRWGAASHQASPDRLRWLYQENPLTRGISTDLVVAVEADGEIVGCFHRCMLPWTENGESRAIASLHDLMVDPEYRHGIGAKLVMAALGGQSAVLLCGSSPAAEAIYERLRFPTLGSVWHMKVLRPLAAIAGAVRMRLAIPASSVVSIGSIASDENEGDFSIRVRSRPSDADLTDALQLDLGSSEQLGWNLATFRWRFFHPLGPPHLLLLISQNARPVARCLMTLEMRHGTLVGRLIEAIGPPALMPRVIAATERTMRRCGAAMAFSVTNWTPGIAALDARRWRRRSPVPASHMFRRGKASGVVPDRVWGSAGDWGFNADRQLLR